MTAQWVQLGGGETLVASRTGAWIQRPQGAALELWGSMPPDHGASLETTRQLLDGAIAAAERGASAATGPLFTARRWPLNLIDQWYTAHHSVALFAVARERYESLNRPELARFVCRKLEEEAGHDCLALDDLRALGYDAEAAVAELAPGRTASAVVDYARHCVSGPRPVGFLGYIYALERRIIRVTDETLRELEDALPGGADATSGVRAHALEFDQEHVEDLLRFVTALPTDDRTEITLACHNTTAIIAGGAACRANHSYDLERERRLASFRAPQVKTTAPRSEP